MARLPRLAIGGVAHLVIHRGRDGLAVCLDDHDRAALLQALTEAARSSRVAIHAFGLHRDHELRLLATPPDGPALGEMMQGLGRRYVRAFNLRHGRRGSPWEGRFRSTVIDAETLFLPCLRHVEFGDTAVSIAGNTSGDESGWSSAAHHLGERLVPGIVEHANFWRLGNTPFEREAAYRRYLSQPADPVLDERIHEAALKGWALGSVEFIAALGDKTSRRTLPLKRGRPRAATVSSGANQSVPN